MYYLFYFIFLRLKPKFQVWKLFIYESLFYFSKSKPAYRIQNLAVQKVQDQIKKKMDLFTHPDLVRLRSCNEWSAVKLVPEVDVCPTVQQ